MKQYKILEFNTHTKKCDIEKILTEDEMSNHHFAKDLIDIMEEGISIKRKFKNGDRVFFISKYRTKIIGSIKGIGSMFNLNTQKMDDGYIIKDDLNGYNHFVSTRAIKKLV